MSHLFQRRHQFTITYVDHAKVQPYGGRRYNETKTITARSKDEAEAIFYQSHPGCTILGTVQTSTNRS